MYVYIHLFVQCNWWKKLDLTELSVVFELFTATVTFAVLVPCLALMCFREWLDVKDQLYAYVCSFVGLTQTPKASKEPTFKLQPGPFDVLQQQAAVNLSS